MTITITHSRLPILLQDEGRFGFAHIGVSSSGAIDLTSYYLAQRLVGNPNNAGAWEISFGSVQFITERDIFLACTGAPVPIRVNNQMHAMNTRIMAPAGSLVTLGTPLIGIRTYIAFRGTIAIDQVLGSLSTDTLSGIGPQPLTQGSSCIINFTQQDLPATDYSPYNYSPRMNYSYSSLISESIPSAWQVNDQSNRIGIRLDPITYNNATLILPPAQAESVPMFRGAIELTPAGQVIIFLADHPTTGGYLRLGVVNSNLCDALAQCRPGGRIFLTRNDSALYKKTMG